MSLDEGKVCKKCGKRKPSTEFYSNGQYKGVKRTRPECKLCSYKLNKGLLILREANEGRWIIS